MRSHSSDRVAEKNSVSSPPSGWGGSLALDSTSALVLRNVSDTCRSVSGSTLNPISTSLLDAAATLFDRDRGVPQHHIRAAPAAQVLQRIAADGHPRLPVAAPLHEEFQRRVGQQGHVA